MGKHKKRKTLNTMRLYFIIIAFLLVFQSTYSQINNEVKNTNSTDTIRTVSFDPVYFVLGTLSDYLGRFQYVEREKQIDKYYPFEKPMVDYLTGYINTELNIVVDTIFEKSNNCEMFSDELSKTLNSFYGEKDELLNNKFETNNQLYSFLAGVYYRYGEKLDSSIFKIQLANSPKHQNCYEFLKQIGCENIFYQYLRNIPFPHISAVCAEFGLDIARDLIPVRPGAHYMVGGVTVDQQRRDHTAESLGGWGGDFERPARGESSGIQQSAGRGCVRQTRGSWGSGSCGGDSRYFPGSTP